MKAAVIVKRDGGNALEIRDVDDPAPGPGEVLIAVKAVGLNRADLSLAQPGRPAGIEVAGQVLALGSGVDAFAIGDRVMAQTTDAYAEKNVAAAATCFKLPRGMDFVEAAAIPVWYLTAHDAIVTNGRMAKGDAVLIQGAAAGVGIAGIQIAKAMGAGTVLGTSRDPAKLARLKEMVDLDVGIDSASEDVGAAVRAATGDRGADVIMDNVGGSALAANLEAAAIKGRIVGVGRLGGKTAELDLDKIALKRISFVGVTFRTRSAEEKAALAQRMASDLWPLIEAGKLRPYVDRTFPLDEAAAAQAHMRSNTHLGKIVLTV